MTYTKVKIVGEEELVDIEDSFSFEGLNFYSLSGGKLLLKTQKSFVLCSYLTYDEFDLNGTEVEFITMGKDSYGFFCEICASKKINSSELVISLTQNGSEFYLKGFEYNEVDISLF